VLVLLLLSNLLINQLNYYYHYHHHLPSTNGINECSIPLRFSNRSCIVSLFLHGCSILCSYNLPRLMNLRASDNCKNLRCVSSSCVFLRLQLAPNILLGTRNSHVVVIIIILYHAYISRVKNHYTI
jgi:hypothetical protein